MTTDEMTASAYETIPGYDDAKSAARRAGDGGPFEGFVERIADRLGAKASARAVFGEPIVRDGFTIIPVARMDDVLKHALVRMPEPITWDEQAEEAAAAARAAADKAGEAASRAH